jgi:glycosyltransferase involved in cell wall biosynthesis
MNFFSEHAHDMHLISFAQLSNERREEFQKIGVKYHGTTGNFHLKKFWLTLNDLRFVRSVLRDQKIDILHSHFLGANAWFASLSRFHPYIVTVMGGGDVNGPDWTPDSNIQDKLLTPYALRNADYITSWSKMMADVVRPFSSTTPIEVVHGGIHLEKFHPGERPKQLLDRWQIPHDAKVIFSPRLMRPLSNIVEIARAADIVTAAIPDAYFVVAFPGVEVDPKYSDDVRQVFAGGSAKENVRFVSEIAHDEIADYFRLADVTVSIPDADGTPMTVLESMACGTPTVIGNLKDYDREYFEHEKTTMMVDVKDPESIADAILRLLGDKELADCITTDAQRRVEATGSYEYQMNKMERIYERLT